ncbi:MAG: J domain-containing protein, partial [Synechococcus sp.]
MNDRVFGVPQRELSHYERLEVSPQADSEVLRQAFRRLSKTLHPDTTSRPASEAARDFQLLRESYDLLTDPERRRRYDVQLQQNMQQGL